MGPAIPVSQHRDQEISCPEDSQRNLSFERVNYCYVLREGRIFLCYLCIDGLSKRIRECGVFATGSDLRFAKGYIEKYFSPKISDGYAVMKIGKDDAVRLDRVRGLAGAVPHMIQRSSKVILPASITNFSACRRCSSSWEKSAKLDATTISSPSRSTPG